MRLTIRDIISHIDIAPVGRESFARLAYTLLHEQHLQADYCIGTLKPSTVDGQPPAQHVWLECFGYVIDFRASEHGFDNALSGVFTHEEALLNGYEYEGTATKIKPLDKHVVTFLTAPLNQLFS